MSVCATVNKNEVNKLQEIPDFVKLGSRSKAGVVILRGRNKKAVLISIFSNQYFWAYISTENSSQSV